MKNHLRGKRSCSGRPPIRFDSPRIESLEGRTLLSGNAVSAENQLPGTSQSVWMVNGLGDTTLQGFSTDMSVNVGGTISFKINDTTKAPYRIDIYRVGYYGGNGARLEATVPASQTLDQAQPAALTNASTGLVDAGNWSVSASWTVPSNAVSGVYIAEPTRSNGSSSMIVFVVRNDSSHSDILYKTNDATWQAYNDWGGNNLYLGGPDTNPPRADAVSYNRPLNNYGNTNLTNIHDQFFYAEFPMVSFLEQNGYDVSYSTDVDTDRYGSLIKNHKIFTAAGHDEYWSGNEFYNIKAARDAGVNMAFLTGNESFWKTYYQPSIDPSATPNRTLVSYKETHANAITDPKNPSIWTGTWEDPRFSSTTDGGVAPNQITGTLFTVNMGADATGTPITVPASDANLRFWRGTAVASLTPGQTLSIGGQVLGYEWDSDVDNGFRPPGLIDLSSTTQNVSQVFVDYGNTVQPGVATNSQVEYRAASGALVFGAGTVQWSWGLSSNHSITDSQNDPDPIIQQSMINLFADMGNVQPTTLIAGLSQATSSTDHVAPTSVINSPATGLSLPSGATMTISGTATDTGGGVVAGVEVSVDGGVTWHPAQGRANWTYQWNPGATGSVNILSRATDDSLNIESPSKGVTVTITTPKSPLIIWDLGKTPSNDSAADSTAGQNGVELGVRFSSDVAGYITGVRFYKGTSNTGTHVGDLWSNTGVLLATATFVDESANGWQEVDFAKPVAVTAGTSYVASYFSHSGSYAADPYFFALNGVNSGPLHVPADLPKQAASVFAYGPSSFPTGTSQSTNYWVDVVFSAVAFVSPRLTSIFPLPNSDGVSATTPITASFTTSIQPGSISFTLTDSLGNKVPATLSYDDTTRTAKLTPNAPLNYPASYTATLTSATDQAGNPLPGPVGWSFNTSFRPGTIYSLWNNAIKPAVPVVSDTGAIEVGVQFTSSVKGTISGIRFYEGDNGSKSNTSGVNNVVHLWSSTGTLLATANYTFTDEANSGWQQVAFSSPVTIAANTVYVASYYAPMGKYAANTGYFTNSGLTSGPLHALSVSEGASGKFSGDGVYVYGEGFPTSSYAGTNYWVDAVFNVGTANTPAVTVKSPSAGATGVSTHSPIAVTFNEAIVPSSASFSLVDSSGKSLSGGLTYNTATNTLGFVPDGVLATGSQYTVTVSGATDNFGNMMTAPATWSFTTSSSTSIFGTTSVPATASASDTSPTEVGVKFLSDVSGTINGLSFYKGAGNTGTHVAHLWSSAGTLLATGTFTGESTSGWQQVTFSSPVTITANTVYIASYYAPSGGYAVTSAYFTNNPTVSGPLLALSDAQAGGNGVYRSGTGFPNSSYNATNYWVDVLFTPSNAKPTPPSVVSESPAQGASGVSTTSNILVGFSGAVQPSSIGLSVADSSGNAVTGSLTYDSTTNIATFAPGAALAVSGTYKVTVSSATDLFGNKLAAPVTWSFTTASATTNTLFSKTSVPAQASSGDTSAIEVGVQFSSSVPGYLNGIRFYKGAGNGGTHTGHLWSASGTLLATATFSGETASGWQQVSFAQPVAIAAGTTYVASYFAPQGNYSVSSGYFSNGGLVASPLTAPATNGLYNYSASGGFPTGTYNGTNYWVDVVFSPGSVTNPPPTVTSESPAPGSKSTSLSAPITATFSEPVRPASIVFSLKDAAGQAVAGTLTYDSPSNTMTFTPSTLLKQGATYTAQVSGATDNYNNPMASPFSWTFTTTTTSTIFSTTSTPAVASSGDTNSTEVGVKFQTSQPGYINGIRFYKGAGNGGTHVGNLWTSSGMLLATATFTSETASGWQEADFANPVEIASGVTYVASYFAPQGNYSDSSSYFANGGTTNGPLQALSNSAAGGNGVYGYGGDAYPTISYNATNYWVDVAFTTQPASTKPPTVVQTTPVSGATNVPTSSNVVATLSEPIVANSAVFTLTDSGGVSVAATVSYDGSYTLTLAPNSPLKPSTTFTATISSAKDYSGNVMAPFTWTFTTSKLATQSLTGLPPVNVGGTVPSFNVGATLSPSPSNNSNQAPTALPSSVRPSQPATTPLANGLPAMSGLPIINNVGSTAATSILRGGSLSNVPQSLGTVAVLDPGSGNDSPIILSVADEVFPSKFETNLAWRICNSAELSDVGQSSQAMFSDHSQTGPLDSPNPTDSALGNLDDSAVSGDDRVIDWVATDPVIDSLIVETTSSAGAGWAKWLLGVIGGLAMSQTGFFPWFRSARRSGSVDQSLRTINRGDRQPKSNSNV